MVNKLLHGVHKFLLYSIGKILHGVCKMSPTVLECSMVQGYANNKPVLDLACPTQNLSYMYFIEEYVSNQCKIVIILQSLEIKPYQLIVSTISIASRGVTHILTVSQLWSKPPKSFQVNGQTVIIIQWTGLLDWNTGLDYLTHILLVFTHSVVAFVMSLLTKCFHGPSTHY